MTQNAVRSMETVFVERNEKFVRLTRFASYNARQKSHITISQIDSIYQAAAL